MCPGTLARAAVVGLVLRACISCSAAAALDVLKPCSAREGPGDAYCGLLGVFEDRQARAGRKIALKIVVLPALSQRPAADALFFLAGGPGQGAAELAATLGDALKPIQLRRDVVFVDQRGTGHSNPLECKDAETDAQGPPGMPAALAARLRACLGQYEGRADVTRYTTRIAMDDLDDVRAFLGYSTIDLYGVSYGTRAAVAYASRHGEHVRAAILDGAMPADMRFPLYMARDAERSMELLFRDCAREPACQRRFPDLPARLRKLLDGLQAHPRHVRFVHPRTGLPREADIDRLMVASALFASLYSGTTAALVPMLIEEAENGDFAGLLALRAAFGPSAETVAKGLEYSVLCSEDAPGVDPQALERASAGTFLGVEAGRAFLEPCGFWPVAKTNDAPAGNGRLAGIAALVVSGEIDPVTPPSWGAEVAALPWKTSRHVVVPGTGHSHVGPGVDGGECVVGIISAFLDASDASAIDVACAGKARRPPFLLSPSGPAVTP